MAGQHGGRPDRAAAAVIQVVGGLPSSSSMTVVPAPAEHRVGGQNGVVEDEADRVAGVPGGGSTRMRSPAASMTSPSRR